MTHDLPTTTIKGKQYVLITTNSKRSMCDGCAFDTAGHGCVDSVRGASVQCIDRLIYIPNTPEAIADHIAKRMEAT
jgi:hypothetical protein